MTRSTHRPKADAEVEISVSPETLALMSALRGDLAAIREMLSDLSDTAAVILDRIDSEVAVQVNRVVTQAEAVVEDPYGRLDPPKGHKPKAQPQRQTPFTRSPRPEQIAWLEAVLADGSWHNPHGIAQEHAVDEPHFRYMKRAVGMRLREMHEEGLVERRDSVERGAMFEYQIP